MKNYRLLQNIFYYLLISDEPCQEMVEHQE